MRHPVEVVAHTSKDSTTSVGKCLAAAAWPTEIVEHFPRSVTTVVKG